MADNASDVEQLLAELFRLASQIVILTNASTSGSGDPDSLASTTNRLSLSAIIISVAAFIIAALQATLQYTGSSESARRKCNFAAIGVASKQVRKRWSFHSWQRKFYYPHLRIDGCSLGRYDKDTVRNFFPSREEFSTLRAQPRATWAQLFSLIGIYSVKDIVGHYYIDADSISPSLDVAPQMVDLVHLGILAIAAGFDSISLNVRERSFQATGQIGSITAEDITGFGRAVKFQRGHPDSYGRIFPKYVPLISVTETVIFGQFSHTLTRIAPAELKSRDLFLESHSMVQALRKNVVLDAPQEIYKLAKFRTFQEHQDITVQWRASMDTRILFPSIFILLTFGYAPCFRVGFPAIKLLAPFLGFCQSLASTVHQKVDKTFAIWNSQRFCRRDILQQIWMGAGGEFLSHLSEGLSF
ncbi:hypothetical protein F5Y15DRAFT_234939 [Xylariaceae sp. FL0016]|nr:hypothetical protein F5Y15DRAFT_234939 [Xylariaceae sp. FL0016]